MLHFCQFFSRTIMTRDNISIRSTNIYLDREIHKYKKNYKIIQIISKNKAYLYILRYNIKGTFQIITDRISYTAHRAIITPSPLFLFFLVFMLILFQVRLSYGQACFAGLGEVQLGILRVRPPPAQARIRKINNKSKIWGEIMSKTQDSSK